MLLGKFLETIYFSLMNMFVTGSADAASLNLGSFACSFASIEDLIRAGFLCYVGDPPLACVGLGACVFKGSKCSYCSSSFYLLTTRFARETI